MTNYQVANQMELEENWARYRDTHPVGEEFSVSYPNGAVDRIQFVDDNTAKGFTHARNCLIGHFIVRLGDDGKYRFGVY